MSNPEKPALMLAALEVLSCDPQAQKLLELAQADHVEIHFDARLKDRGAYGFDYCGRPEIKICPHDGDGKARSALEIAQTLVHELRHHWQYKELGITSKNLTYINKTPRMAFFLNRVVEADAMAFQRRFRGIAEGEVQAKETDSLSKWFTEAIENNAMALDYDLKNAVHIDAVINRYTYYKTKKTPFDKNKSAPELTISSLRGLLRAGTEEDAPPYLDTLSDRQFETLVLGNALRPAFHAVRLMEKFRDALGRKDKKEMEFLRPLVRQKILSLS